MQVHREKEYQQQAKFSREIKAHLSTTNRPSGVMDRDPHRAGDLVVDQPNRQLDLTLVSTYLELIYLLCYLNYFIRIECYLFDWIAVIIEETMDLELLPSQS